MSKIRSMVATQSSVGEPERRGDERSEAARSGGSSTLEPDAVPVAPDSEVPARHARRRFTTAYKLAILRRADACTRHGELGALLRKEGLYSSHLITWRQQREAGLTPKKRGPEGDGRRSAAEEARAGESPLDVAAAEGGSAARVPKKSFRAPTDPPETVRERRGRLMIAVDDATPTLGAAPACRVLGLLAGLAVSGASTGRGRAPSTGAAPRAWIRSSVSGVLDLLHTRFIDQAPAQVHATLLDEGTYLCSPRTMYRVLDAAHEIKERRDQVRRPHYAAPELLATRPNEVWSWDITKLLGPGQVDVLLSLRHPRHLQPLRRRLDAGPARERRPRRAPHRRDLREARHSRRASSRSMRTAAPSMTEQARGAAAGRPRRDQNPQPPARVERQSVFGSAVQDAQILSAVSRAVRIARGRPRVWAGASFPGTTRSTATADSGFSRRPSCTSARPPRSARIGSRCSRPPTRPIPSASSTDGHTPQICRPPCGSTRRRRKSTAQDAPGTTIVTSDDLRVDPILDADDHVAVMIIDRNATLITPTLVSQCH